MKIPESKAGILLKGQAPVSLWTGPSRRAWAGPAPPGPLHRPAGPARALPGRLWRGRVLPPAPPRGPHLQGRPQLGRGVSPVPGGWHGPCVHPTAAAPADLRCPRAGRWVTARRGPPLTALDERPATTGCARRADTPGAGLPWCFMSAGTPSGSRGRASGGLRTR